MNRFALLLSAGLLFNHTIATAQFVPLSELPAVPEMIPEKDAQRLIHPVETVQYPTGLEPPPEGGSETIANFLKKWEPNVDTRLPEGASQAATRISRLIEQGYHDSALREIDKRQQHDDTLSRPGQDAQLLFLKGRAYAAKGDTAQATAVYREMTFRYPELAEPWNNLAVAQMKVGLFNEALSSLQSALRIRPDYAVANQNIGLIYTLLAKQSFDKAASLGAPGAHAHAQHLEHFLHGK